MVTRWSIVWGVGIFFVSCRAVPPTFGAAPALSESPRSSESRVEVTAPASASPLSLYGFSKSGKYVLTRAATPEAIVTALETATLVARLPLSREAVLVEATDDQAV